MKNLRSTKTIIYPFIFAVFPVISDFLINKNKILIQDLFSVIGLFFFIALVLLVGFGFILKSRVKAGILTSIIFYILFSFHDIVYLVEIIAKNIGYSRQAHSLMYSQNGLWIWLIIDIIVILLLSKRIVSDKWPNYQINQFLSIFSIGLVLIMLFNAVAPFKKYPPKNTQSDSSFNTDWGTSI
jgi:glucan phosphoethanolaminetransferase (alkaline phosphatase superfamily)